MTAAAALAAAAAAHLSEHRLAEAEAAYRQALAQAPGYGPALHGLGLLAARAGRLDLAARLLEQAVQATPEEAEALRHLGQVRLDAGTPARPPLARALALDPGEPGTLEALGRALADPIWHRRALAPAPGFVAARLNLATLLSAEAGSGEIRRALALAPEAAAGWFNLGVLGAGLAAYERALVLDPGHLEAAVNRGRLLAPARPSRAAPALRRALALAPGNAAALNELARLVQGGLDGPRALRLFGRAHAANAADPALHSNWLQQHLYDPEVAPETLLARHLGWARRHAGPPRREDEAREDQARDADPERRLRLGYVSADLGRHPVGFFLLPALRHRDRAAFEVVCYSGRPAADAWTRRLGAEADGWVETAGLDDAALEARIRADRIDLLVDLAGHTAGNRLAVFARRPAPLQLSWLGYPGTTGLAAIDHLLADSAQIPPGDEGRYVEQVERLDPGYVCYDPPEDAPAVAPLPAKARGHLTFGSLNNPAKLNPAVLRLWAGVLRAVPGARLLLAWPSLADPEVRSRLEALAAAAGLAPARLDLRPGGAPRDFLARYGEIDVALDPFPYSGGLTTLEALWMGVPVVTWPGERFAGRHAASHLGQAGLADWICASPEAYVARAAEAAADLERLAALRAALRRRLAASPLLDGAGFARRLEALYRGLWRRWGAGRGTAQ